MKPWLQTFFVLSFLWLLPATDSIAASGSSTRENTRQIKAPLPEMLLYEAAEQAVEDGYAEIILEAESKIAPEGANADNKPVGEKNVPSETEFIDN